MPALAYSPSVLFTGEVQSLSVKGSVFKAKLVPGGLVFSRKIPNFLIQPGCNHGLFSVGCGLSQAAYEFTASVSDPGTPGYPYTFTLSGLARTAGGALPTLAEHYAGGWIEFGSGGTLERLPILRSSSVSAGVLTVTLSRDPIVFPSVSAPVKLWPGCDGRWDTCRSKFGNGVNFGGHPLMPVGNPSLLKISTGVAGGKK
jgi:hypothetical protein